MSLKDLNRKERTILKKYGQVEKGLYRDVLVPADMTLHALHYAIMRLFGWQNCHLHQYEVHFHIIDKFDLLFQCHQDCMYWHYHYYR